ncbi:MAG TPA: tetratricopeptide repeat protein [Thermoanaerobaculia bacterium]|nr:tetratricopeptide repeat protein [Thermoanaerobaculia bacterium]
MRRPSTVRWAAWLLPAALAAGGCAAFSFRTPEPGPQARVLTGVPVRNFGLKSCGPGSLSAVLSYHGQPVSLEELDAVLPKGRNEGVVTLDMVLEARRRGYDARLVEGTPELVERELREGRPVILMLKVLDSLGQGRDLFHYIVVDGIEPAKGLVRVQLGDEKLRWTTFKRLDRRWRATRRAALLIAPGGAPGGPGTQTATRNTLRYSVSLEEAGRAAEAVPLYRDLLEDDPGSALLWTNLGNAEAGRGEAALAEAAYRRALELESAHADALNNLAWLLLEQGDRLAEAEELARRAVASGGPDPHLALDTLGRVLRARGRCQEAIEVFTQALAAAPAAAGLALPDCPE